MDFPEKNLQNEKQFPKRLRAFALAFRGVTEAWKSELHFQIQTLIAVAVIAVGFWLQITLLEWSLITLAISSVLTAELLNTAIEKTLDRVSDEFHPLTKSAKDIAAGAVLISACGSVIIGVIIFLPRFIQLFKHVSAGS